VVAILPGGPANRSTFSDAKVQYFLGYGKLKLNFAVLGFEKEHTIYNKPNIRGEGKKRLS
jgi:hypothetical protein